VDDDVLHVRLAVADVVFEAAGELVCVRECHVRGHGHGHEYDQAAGGVQQPQFPRWLTRAVEHELGDALALRLIGWGAVLVGACGDWLLKRFQVRVHVVDARLVAQRRFDALGDIVGVADGDVWGELEVQRDADSSVVFVDGMLWASRTSRSASATASGRSRRSNPSRSGSRCTTTSESGSASCTAASTASAVPWPSTIAWPGATATTASAK
jgi:hypothetical protein